MTSISHDRPYYSGAFATLYHGDALEILPQLPAASVAAVVTDPPFTLWSASSGRGTAWADTINAARWYTTWYSQCARVLRCDGALWTLASWRTLPLVLKAAADADLYVSSVAVWYKLWIGPGGSRGLRTRYEMCALMPMPDWRQPDRAAPDVWGIQGIVCKKPTGHPAEKPVALMEHILGLSHLPPGSTVLDPFAGSGTTLLAAAERGLHAIGIEASPRWCAVAEARLAALQPPLVTEL